MKYLVTGATSGLGKNAAEWLLESGFKVLATGRNASSGNELRRLGAEFFPLDLTGCPAGNLETLLAGVDAIWHCAAKSSPWGEASAFFAASLEVTRRLGEAAGRRGIARFIHVSTPSIYFEYKHRHGVTEDFRARRLVNAYAASKYAGEQAIRELATTYPATRYIVLRPRAIFGPHDRVLLPRLLRQIERDQGRLRLPGGGNALLDLTFVGNVVHAMQLATTQPRLRSGAAYNISNHEPGRLGEQLKQLICDEMGIHCRMESIPYPLLQGLAASMELLSLLTRREPMLTRYGVGAVSFDMTLSPRRAIDELGYSPPYSMAEGIRQTAHWFRDHGKLGQWLN